MCNPDAAAAPDEQRRADLVFQVANATADGRFLNANCYSGLSETAIVGRRDDIAQMPQPKGLQFVTPPLRHLATT